MRISVSGTTPALYPGDHDSYTAAQAFISIPLFFSALMPYPAMPDWLLFCARFNPVSCATDAARAAAAGSGRIGCSTDSRGSRHALRLLRYFQKSYGGITIKKFTTGVLCALVCIVCAAGCISGEPASSGNPVAIVQTDGTPFTLPHTAERIVLMNPNAAEMLQVIGASRSILDHEGLGGLFPDAVSVGKWDVPDVETVSSLNPDVVIAFASSKPKNADVIEAAGIPIVYIDCYKPATMAQDVTALGILTGNGEKAEEFIAFYNDVMDEVAEAVRDAADIPVVYLFLWLPPHRIIQWKYVMNMQAGING